LDLHGKHGQKRQPAIGFRQHGGAGKLEIPLGGSRIVSLDAAGKLEILLGGSRIVSLDAAIQNGAARRQESLGS